MKIYKYGDNVDTDVIIPARYLNSFDAKELASHAMVDIDPDFAKTVENGDIIVAGKNFGCGSSREHAPLCLKTAGTKCVIARSFAVCCLPAHTLQKYENVWKCGDTVRTVSQQYGALEPHCGTGRYPGRSRYFKAGHASG